jgi:uncharacterized protein (DUF1684 family)
MRVLLILVCYFFTGISFAQSKTYKDSIESYFKKYVKEHEVVTGKDKELMSFFPVNEKFRINCRFERTINSPWFRMESSGPVKRNYRVYGIIHFSTDDTVVSLNIYQSQDLMTTQEYKDHLFIPFTDATSGEETYASGRYIDLEIKDIVNDKVLIDFNKAYNPYCAYVSGKYNCPIPPPENRLSVAIRAGEKAFGKAH